MTWQDKMQLAVKKQSSSTWRTHFCSGAGMSLCSIHISTSRMCSWCSMLLYTQGENEMEWHGEK